MNLYTILDQLENNWMREVKICYALGLEEYKEQIERALRSSRVMGREARVLEKRATPSRDDVPMSLPFVVGRKYSMDDFRSVPVGTTPSELKDHLGVYVLAIVETSQGEELLVADKEEGITLLPKTHLINPSNSL